MSAEEYKPIHERPHDIVRVPYWQESVFLMWWDDGSGIGGIHRIGNEPNATPPSVNNWNAVFTRDGQRWRGSHNHPMEPHHRTKQGLSCEPSAFEASDEGWHFTISDDDCELDLLVSDITPLLHVFPQDKVGEVHRDYAKDHYENSGYIKGTARVGAKTFEVNGFCYRDHSWGRREWGTLLSHRYFAATVGPEFTCNTIFWQGLDGDIKHYGAVIRSGEITYADHVEFIVYLEPDGISHRAGQVVFHLPDGEVIDIRPTLVDAVINAQGGKDNHSLFCNDSIVTFEYKGKKGFGDFEFTNNPRGGARPLTHSSSALLKNGLFQREAKF